MQWQQEQVLALAPDRTSVKAAQGLTVVGKWPTLGVAADVALWGECQGSGKTPYQTAIDLADIAFKCSCPSRKFPCKHALALFLLYTEATEPFATKTELPGWVQSWLDKRAKRQTTEDAARPVNPGASATAAITAVTTAANPIIEASTVTDPKAQQRRSAARAEKVAKGIEELRTWLQDLVRNGYVDAQSRPYRYWQQMAARLIDAQAPGLASQVEALGGIIVSGDGWADRLTVALGKLFLLLEAYQRLEILPEPLQHDVRTLIGWHQSKEELLTGEPVVDRWHVLSHTITPEEPLISQRIWLRGCTTDHYALILNFAHPSNRQALDPFWRVDAMVDATLFFYRSAVPQRAIATAVAVPPTGFSTNSNNMVAEPIACSIAAASHHYQQQLAVLPWLTTLPITLADITVALDYQAGAARTFLCDGANNLVPLNPKSKVLWQLLSITGGHPAHLFCEWQEDGVVPLGVWHEGWYWAL